MGFQVLIVENRNAKRKNYLGKKKKKPQDFVCHLASGLRIDKS